MSIARVSVLCICLLLGAPVFAQTYDIVLSGGRVMDPETGVDAVRNVGITKGQVARISPQTLAGKRVIDEYVIVAGTILIDQGKLNADTFPGKPFLTAQPGK